MAKIRLTDVTIRNLPTPASGQRTYLDESLVGFGVRVSQGGTKSFTLMHGERRQLTTIGRVGVVSLSQARQKARELLAAETLGLVEEPERMPFEEAVGMYLAAYRGKNRPSTAAETERLIRKHLRFTRAVGSITASDVTAAIEALESTPSEQQHLFVAARALFNWLVRRRVIAQSPLAGIDAPQRPISRDRVLADQELVLVFEEAGDDDFGDLVRLLILTGQRVGQIVNLRASFIDKEARLLAWPAQFMKGNRSHAVPFGPLAAEIIERRLGGELIFPSQSNATKPFSNFSNAKRRLDQACGPLTHWTLHDLRRTFTTQLAGLGVAPHVCERILAHSGGAISGVAAIYNRHNYLPEMRNAIESWERRLQTLMQL